MKPEYIILYHADVLDRDMPKISTDSKKHIRKAIETKLTTAPQDFGEPLRHTMKGYWKLRVGDYRIIYKIKINTVMILRIGHRREVYEKYMNRNLS